MVKKLSKLSSFRKIPAIANNYALTYHQVHQRWGERILFDFGRKLFLTCNPDDISKILDQSSHLVERSQIFKEFAPVLGRGILLADGEEWKQGRKALTRPFLRKSHKEIARIATQLTLHLRGDVSAYRLSENLVYSLVDKLIFHGALESKKPQGETLRKNMTDLTQYYYRQQSRLLSRSHFWRPFQHRKIQKKIQFMRKFAQSFLSQREDIELNQRIKKFHPQDQELMIDQFINAIAAGYDTTSSTLSWCLHELSQHPEWQYRALKSNDDLKRVIFECLRLYPSVGVILRTSLGPIALSGFEVPKGSEIILNIYSLQRQSQHYSTPEAFIPDRFPKSDFTQTKTFIPFGLGPHICLGQTLALQILEVLLHSLLTQYQFISLNQPSLVAHTTLKPNMDHKIKIEKRT